MQMSMCDPRVHHLSAKEGCAVFRHGKRRLYVFCASGSVFVVALLRGKSVTVFSPPPSKLVGLAQNFVLQARNQFAGPDTVYKHVSLARLNRMLFHSME